MKVLFVVNGDARSSRPWSGVPNHLLVEMVSRGIGVVNVDMSRVWHLRWPRILYNRIFRKVIRRWRNVPYEATRLCIEQTNKWLRKVAKHHADCDLALITSFALIVQASRYPAFWFTIGRLAMRVGFFTAFACRHLKRKLNAINWLRLGQLQRL